MFWVQVDESGTHVDMFDGAVFPDVQARLTVVGYAFGPEVGGHVDAVHPRFGAQRFVGHEVSSWVA